MTVIITLLCVGPPWVPDLLRCLLEIPPVYICSEFLEACP